MSNKPKRSWIELKKDEECRACTRIGPHACDSKSIVEMMRAMNDTKESKAPDYMGVVDKAEDVVYNEPQTETSPKKPATEPWNPSENPWKRDYMRVKGKRKGWRARFVSKKNIERNLDDGWTVASRENYGGLYDTVAGEEAQLDTTIKRRELILMEIPEDKIKLRDEFYRNKSKRAAEANKKSFSNEIERQTGMQTYVPQGYS